MSEFAKESSVRVPLVSPAARPPLIARAHPGENPPVGIILCSSADDALARYTLDTLPNKVMAREYRLALPAVKKLEAELKATWKRLEKAGRKA